MKIYAEIMKTDDEKRMVYGYASTETLDSQEEKVSKEAVADALTDYMKWANIREMHQPSAVGIAKEAEIDDKGLYVVAKVVDDEAWNKVKEGVYKGFSLGGKKLTKVDEVITALKLTEISLVDRPANPDCKFDVWKAEDLHTTSSAHGCDEPEKGETIFHVMKADGKTCHCGVFAKVEKVENPELKKAQEDLRKYAGQEIYDSQTALYALSNLYYLLTSEKAEIENNAEQVALLETVVKNLKAFIASEILEDHEEALTMAEKTDDLQKVGARNSKSDMEKVQGIHDHAVTLGADCSSKKAEGIDDLQKRLDNALAKVTLFDTLQEGLEKVGIKEGESIPEFITKVQGEKETLEKRVKELESQPAPAKGALKVVEKGQDISPVAETVEPIKKTDGTENDVATEIKKIHKSGGKRLN
jgi:phage head maturation protease